MYVSTMMDSTMRNDGRNDADGGGNDGQIETSNRQPKLDNGNEATASSTSSSAAPQVGRTKKDLSKMVWCKDGKTEHQAWLLEDTLEGKEKALVEWQTTGRRKLVPVSWIRFDIPRQRRRTSRSEINVKSFDGAAYGSRDEDDDDEKDKKGKNSGPKRKRKGSTAQKQPADDNNKKRKSSTSAPVSTAAKKVGTVTLKKTKKRGVNGNIDKENIQRRRPSAGSAAMTIRTESNADATVSSKAQDERNKRGGATQEPAESRNPVPLMKENDSNKRNSNGNTASNKSKTQNNEGPVGNMLVGNGDSNRASPLNNSSGNFIKVDASPTNEESKSVNGKPKKVTSSNNHGPSSIYGSDSMKMPDRQEQDNSNIGNPDVSSAEKGHKQAAVRSIPIATSVDESLKTRTTFASTFLTQKFLKKDSLSKGQVDDANPAIYNKMRAGATGNKLMEQKSNDDKSGVRQEKSSSTDPIVVRKTTTRKRCPPAGLQQGERCIVKPIWPAFSSISPGQYEVKFAKAGMEFLHACLVEDITNLLEDVRVMKPEDVDSILKGKEPTSDMVVAKDR